MRNRVFGKTSEKKQSGKNEGKPKSSKTKRPRGQQRGSKGHGPTERPDLPIREESINFTEEPRCSNCNKHYTPDEIQETEIIEVEVKAYTRRIKRYRMKKGCTCKGVPETVTAPMLAKIMPRSPYGISIWEEVLLNKFHYSQPTNRLLNQYAELGLPISPGTIAGGLKKLKECFKPVYDALYNQQMTENRFHNDESGWKVFESIEDKTGNRWWLWVSRSASVVYFQIAPGRGANVPVDYFKNIENQDIIVICDRFSAYKSMARQLPFIILAFCWAHVRRDFLDAARKYPDLEEWALSWTDQIGEIYHFNNQRCKAFDIRLSIKEQTASFNEHHQQLIEAMAEMQKQRDISIEVFKPANADSTLLSEIKYKILISLETHWEGLSIFVDYPEVPMDNNKGERSIRNPVTGKKNFYGSGSVWSSELAAFMFSIFQTVALWGLNCKHWLRLYLTACAENQGKAPDDLTTFLPWQMDEEQRNILSKPFNTS